LDWLLLEIQSDTKHIMEGNEYDIPIPTLCNDLIIQYIFYLFKNCLKLHVIIKLVR
jgi:hypothetical protein